MKELPENLNPLSKEISIYIGFVLTCCTYTVIAPSYPRVAEDKGMPIWLIGIIFALSPFANFVTTPFLGKYMNRMGRKNVVLANFVLSGLALVILSPIEYTDLTGLIILSIASRVVSGIGASCRFTATITIFMSDYPDRIQSMIGKMEGSIGLGLVVGPVLVIIFSYISLFAAILIIGAVIMLFTPIAWKMLGTFREYNIREINIDRIRLVRRPKIFLTLLMAFAFLFNFAFVQTLLEIHLADFGMSHFFIQLCFIFQSAVYFIMSLTAGPMLRKLKENNIMFIGALSLGLSYILMAPWKLIFPDNVWLVVISLPFSSIGQSLTYVFCVAYMIKVAEFEYEYTNDDILTDVLSSFCVFAGSFGEVIGPLYAGFVADLIGIENCCVLVGIASFIFAIVYAIGTGVFTDYCKKDKYKKSSLLINTKTKVVPGLV